MKLTYQQLIILTLIIIGVIIGIYDYSKSEGTWDLVVCKNRKSKDVGCILEEHYILKGYSSQRECMEKGIELGKNTGFNCGKDCKYNNSVMVCKIVCSSDSPCRD